jgi:hypothetical protein
MAQRIAARHRAAPIGRLAQWIDHAAKPTIARRQAISRGAGHCPHTRASPQTLRAAERGGTQAMRTGADDFGRYVGTSAPLDPHPIANGEVLREPRAFER